MLCENFTIDKSGAQTMQINRIFIHQINVRSLTLCRYTHNDIFISYVI